MEGNERTASRILDTETLRLGLLAGARRVVAFREELDRINVFPVPDRDTGSNLAATMTSVIHRLASPHASVAAVGASMTSGALSGAQGNSGVIVAQFFQGMREGFADAVHLTMDRFVGAIHHASTSARRALAKPREGTILTVITDVANHLNERVHHLPDFKALIEEGVRVARESLARTPDRLDALKKAGVVDAGALGFVRFLEGIRDYLVDGHSDAEETAWPAADVATIPNAGALGRVDFRYCAEAVVTGRGIDREAVMAALSDLGNSVIVAGSDETIHAHVHSNVPAYVLEALADFGTLESTKVEDMLQGLMEPPPESAERVGIAVVTDSVCDLPPRWLTEHCVHVVPVRVRFGDETLVDRVDITPRQFYRRLASDPSFPRTSQPSPGDYLTLYRHLSRHYEGILSIHLSAEVSGTHQLAEQTARQVSDEAGVPIRVVDSRTASGAEGLVTWAAVRAIDAGVPLDAVASLTRAIVDDVRIFVFVPTIENFVRGGRLSPTQGRISNLLHLRPILTVEDGSIGLAAKAIGVRNARRRTVAMAVREARAMAQPVFALSHTDVPVLAAAVESELRRRFPESEFFRSDAAPALGSHAGVGGLAIAVMDVDAVDVAIAAAIAEAQAREQRGEA